MKISFDKKNQKNTDLLVSLFFAGEEGAPSGLELSANQKKFIQSAIKQAAIKKEKAWSLFIPYLPDFSSPVMLYCVGKKADFKTSLNWETLGAKMYSALSKFNFANIQINCMDLPDGSANIANGFLLKSWDFIEYKTKQAKNFTEKTLKSVTFCLPKATDAEKIFTPLQSTADGVFLARELISHPSNVMYPKSIANKVKELEKLGLKVEILDEKQLQKLGCNALLGVGQGSEFDSYIAVMSWNGGKKSDKPLAFVGKGVTFDTGGISIKPRQNMDKMKTDMSGAAAVIGLMKSLASRKAKVNAVGLIGLVENMPSGTAQRPGDIVKSMSGQTIEILDTDAEGRLVLADVLWYTQDRFKPQLMVNLATLTGAIVIALGDEHAGLFCNDDTLAKKLLEAGKETDEKLWRMPLSDNYDKMVDSDIADLRNLGAGEGANSITAAQFLQRFVNKTPWAHLDIAGVAFPSREKNFSKKGAAGFGVRLLEKFIQKNYE